MRRHPPRQAPTPVRRSTGAGVRCSQAGFSYLETLIAVTLIAVALAPAIESLQTGMLGATVHERAATLHYRAAGRLEELLAQPYAALDAAALAAGSSTVASSYSDTAGTTDRRLAYLARYDVDNADTDGNRFTGGDEGVVWVRVAIEGSSIALDSLRRW